MYLAAILVLMLIAPLASILVEALVAGGPLAGLVLKWFVFWGIGARLGLAGLKQVTQPAFTAQTIFEIADPKAQVIVQELGFANLAFGLMGLLSLAFPAFLQPAAVGGGLFYLLAGVMHALRAGKTRTETIAMVSDLGIVAVLAVAAVL
ncbi:hypothetical protein GGQ86_003806 [Xanthobacter flavus]|uniref:Uncharacterized protein n=1 Tax=Xanthobacter flavus TaxID=281 RepID=A0A9W6FL86_XANFL|nr:DUF6790 family protein [Xanthobacter flavus]MDR6335311.1 hypothetical protein [Xanthobacter flavus]GLI24136.1 hypothetical protein XFLAVUS301_38100 [Xanthobacter flavus]